MQNFFNNSIKSLAKAKTFPRKLRVVTDGTNIETKKDFPGAGSVTKEKTVVDKRGKIKTIEVTVWGFKLIALFAVGLRIPVAIKVVQIQRLESKFTQGLIKTAKENLAHSKIQDMLIRLTQEVLFDRVLFDNLIAMMAKFGCVFRNFMT
jgi:hypothetical protein